MIQDWNQEQHGNPAFNAVAAQWEANGDIVLAAVDGVSGPAVGIGVAHLFDENKTTHPGWYIDISVQQGRRGIGHGFGLVRELLRRIPAKPVYLVREADEDRPFKEGFGFVEVTEPYNVKGYNSALTLFVAEEPNPDWTPEDRDE